MPFNFSQYAVKGKEFVNQLAKELGDEKETDKAKRILTATLRVLRDLLPTEESVQLLAQLPMFSLFLFFERRIFQMNIFNT